MTNMRYEHSLSKFLAKAGNWGNLVSKCALPVTIGLFGGWNWRPVPPPIMLILIIPNKNCNLEFENIPNYWVTFYWSCISYSSCWINSKQSLDTVVVDKCKFIGAAFLPDTQRKHSTQSWYSRQVGSLCKQLPWSRPCRHHRVARVGLLGGLPLVFGAGVETLGLGIARSICVSPFFSARSGQCCLIFINQPGRLPRCPRSC